MFENENSYSNLVYQSACDKKKYKMKEQNV